MPAPPAHSSLPSGRRRHGTGSGSRAWRTRESLAIPQHLHIWEAHASQVSHSSVYFGDSCRTARGRGRQVWSCPQQGGVSDQGPTPAAKAGSPGSHPRQRPSGVERAGLWLPFSTELCWAGMGSLTQPRPEHQGRAQWLGGCGGSGCPRDHRGLAAAPARWLYEGTLKFLMKLCSGRERNADWKCHPRARWRLAAAAQETWRSLLQWLQLRRQVAPRVDAVGDAVL